MDVSPFRPHSPAQGHDEIHQKPGGGIRGGRLALPNLICSSHCSARFIGDHASSSSLKGFARSYSGAGCRRLLVERLSSRLRYDPRAMPKDEIRAGSQLDGRLIGSFADHVVVATARSALRDGYLPKRPTGAG